MKKIVEIWRDSKGWYNKELKPFRVVVKTPQEEYELLNMLLKHGCKYKYRI